jgi:hypothetical protein
VFRITYSKKEKENTMLQIDNAIAETNLRVGHVFLGEGDYILKEDDFKKEISDWNFIFWIFYIFAIAIASPFIMIYKFLLKKIRGY